MLGGSDICNINIDFIHKFQYISFDLETQFRSLKYAFFLVSPVNVYRHIGVVDVGTKKTVDRILYLDSI